MKNVEVHILVLFNLHTKQKIINYSTVYSSHYQSHCKNQFYIISLDFQGLLWLHKPFVVYCTSQLLNLIKINVDTVTTITALIHFCYNLCGRHQGLQNQTCVTEDFSPNLGTPISIFLQCYLYSTCIPRCMLEMNSWRKQHLSENKKLYWIPCPVFFLVNILFRTY